MKHLLSIDLSTNCTGWSVFDIETEKLITYGILKPQVKGLSKMEYPKQQLYKMIDMAEKVRSVIKNFSPFHIVIEEVAGSKNRLSQKTLDGVHWIILYLNMEYLDIISYYDVTGINGWRTDLKIVLDEADKLHNKEARLINKQLGPKSNQIHIIDNKDLACRYVNQNYNLVLDPIENNGDSDIGDSIAMGSAWLKFKCPSTEKSSLQKVKSEI